MNGILIDKFMNELKPYKYISFDIFDTLMFRTVEKPEIIFELVNEMFNKKNNQCIIDFRQKRIEAEKQARRVKVGSDVTLDLIYSFMPYDRSDLDQLISIERECEILNCIPNKIMVDILNHCILEGKIVIIISDMYLDRKTIEGILNKIFAKYHYLFISGEIGLTKRSGKLFPYVLENLDIIASEIVHIGDDHNSDIIMPSIYGIKSLERLANNHMIKRYHYNYKFRNIFVEHFETFLDRNFQSEDVISPEFRVGYGVIGPMLMEFCQWLHQAKKENNVRVLCFISREGYLIKHCYEILYPEESNEIKYIDLNKNLLRLPLINKANFTEQLLASIPTFEEYNWEQIFEYVGLDYSSKVIELIKEHNSGFDANAIIRRKDIIYGKFNEVFDLIFVLITNQINDQVFLLQKYLRDLDFQDNTIGLVNNSINGNGQWMLEKFMRQHNMNCVIHGFQFIKSSECENKLHDRCHAWMMKNYYNNYCIHQFNKFVLVFEHLLFEPIGTAKKFVLNSGIRVEVYHEDCRQEVKNFKTINSIQKATIKFLTDYNCNISEIPYGAGFKLLISMINHPFYDDASMICNLYNDDVEGDRKISDTRIKFSLKYILGKNLPSTISWTQGFFTLKHINNHLIDLYNFRMWLRYCKQNFIKDDIK